MDVGGRTLLKGIDMTLFILGAGFSTIKSVPVVKDFLFQMMKAEDWCKTKGRTEEAKSIRIVLDARIEAMPAGYRTEIDLDDIEQLFSLLAVQKGNDEVVLRAMRHAIAATIDFSLSVHSPDSKRYKLKVPHLSSEPNNDEKPVVLRNGYMERYEHVVAELFGKNVIYDYDSAVSVITFNYDTVLESTFERLGIDYSYGLFGTSSETNRHNRKRAEGIRVHKLHGSVNWKQIRGRNGVEVFADYEQLRRSETDAAPMIIPPTWTKTPTKAILKVWSNAVQAISEAARVIVVGYSFPSTDQHSRLLISAGLATNTQLRDILVIDPLASSVAAKLGEYIRVQRLSSRQILTEDRQLIYTSTQLTEILRKVGIHVTNGVKWSQ